MLVKLDFPRNSRLCSLLSLRKVNNVLGRISTIDHHNIIHIKISIFVSRARDTEYQYRETTNMVNYGVYYRRKGGDKLCYYVKGY